MSSSREDSPDWLRCFQAPTLSLSSSDTTPNKISEVVGAELQCADAEEVTSNNHVKPRSAGRSVLTISSDSESCPGDSLRSETKLNDNRNDVGSTEESPSKKVVKKGSPKRKPKLEDHTPKEEENLNDNAQKKGQDVDIEVAEEDTSGKPVGPHVSTSSLPLVISEKVNRSKALVECEGESIDLSGDMGAVGRILIPDAPSGNCEMYLDLKGTIYRTMIVPSRTFCVVSFGQSEAKIEAIMNDFIQLKPQSNVYEAETMVEGTLEGFSFDSEDEADTMPKAISHQMDQDEGIEGQNNGKMKRKSEKLSVAGRKKGKNTGGKLQVANKARKKTHVSKKAKARK